MGRELRMVPKNWEHPRDENGHYRPMYEPSFKKSMLDWVKGWFMWQKGYRRNYGDDTWVKKDDDMDYTYSEWSGTFPDEDMYMPDFEPEDCTHFQMYETCSEGTPISPVMETKEELARWLADNNASAFAGMTATYEQWLNTIEQGFALSAIYTPETGIIPRVCAK